MSIAGRQAEYPAAAMTGRFRTKAAICKTVPRDTGARISEVFAAPDSCVEELLQLTER